MPIIKVINTEKSSRMLERGNKLSLIVDSRTDKETLAEELRTVYGLKVSKINVLHTAKGEKKAIVTLDKSHTPDEIATKFGLVM
ncbi:MAG: 50S ribosomal protein L23 [Candidatus Micrarchaeia archaeon]